MGSAHCEEAAPARRDYLPCPSVRQAVYPAPRAPQRTDWLPRPEGYSTRGHEPLEPKPWMMRIARRIVPAADNSPRSGSPEEKHLVREWMSAVRNCGRSLFSTVGTVIKAATRCRSMAFSRSLGSLLEAKQRWCETAADRAGWT